MVRPLAAHENGSGFKLPSHLSTFRDLCLSQYGTVGSLASKAGHESIDLGLIHARALGFNHAITLSKFCMYTFALANQARFPL